MSVKIDLTDEERVETFLESLFEASVDGELLEVELAKPRLLRWFTTRESTEDGDIDFLNVDAVIRAIHHPGPALTVHTARNAWFTEDPNTIERFWAEWEVV